MIKDLLSIMFPSNCVGCNNTLVKGEDFLCINCHIKTPFCDDFLLPSSNWLSGGANNLGALLFYDKKGVTQNILHEIKYKDNKKLARYFGELIGLKLLEHNIDFDVLIPVPLHKKKQKIRGYNQAEEIAKGIASKTNKMIVNNVLVRVKNTNTQTKKDKNLREENVKSAFEINNELPVKNKKVVLIDDVITTGATINECLKTINKVDNVNVFVVSLAIVKL